MANVTVVDDFREGGNPAPVSRGGPVLRTFVGRVNLNVSYATGGDTVAALPTGVGSLKYLQVTPFPAPGIDRMYSWNGDRTTPKIGAKVISTAAEVAAATDLSAVALDLLAVFEQ